MTKVSLAFANKNTYKIKLHLKLINYPNQCEKATIYKSPTMSLLVYTLTVKKNSNLKNVKRYFLIINTLRRRFCFFFHLDNKQTTINTKQFYLSFIFMSMNLILRLRFQRTQFSKNCRTIRSYAMLCVVHTEIH